MKQTVLGIKLLQGNKTLSFNTIYDCTQVVCCLHIEQADNYSSICLSFSRCVCDNKEACLNRQYPWLLLTIRNKTIELTQCNDQAYWTLVFALFSCPISTPRFSKASSFHAIISVLGPFCHTKDFFYSQVLPNIGHKNCYLTFLFSHSIMWNLF